MTTDITALIVEARERTRNNIKGTNTLVQRLADALETETRTSSRRRQSMEREEFIDRTAKAIAESAGIGTRWDQVWPMTEAAYTDMAEAALDVFEKAVPEPQGEPEWEYAIGAEYEDRPGKFWRDHEWNVTTELSEALDMLDSALPIFSNAKILRRRPSTPWEPYSNDVPAHSSTQNAPDLPKSDISSKDDLARLAMSAALEADEAGKRWRMESRHTNHEVGSHDA